jgi:hypothetical protein
LFPLDVGDVVSLQRAQFCPMLILLAQLFALLWTAFYVGVRTLLHLPFAIGCAALNDLSPNSKGRDGKCVFYEGTVTHVRKKPAQHSFQYVFLLSIGLLHATQTTVISGLKGSCAFELAEFIFRYFFDRYPVRMAVVSLDDPPAWWAAQATDYLTAADARTFAQTKGDLFRWTCV